MWTLTFISTKYLCDKGSPWSTYQIIRNLSLSNKQQLCKLLSISLTRCEAAHIVISQQMREPTWDNNSLILYTHLFTQGIGADLFILFYSATS